MIESTLSLPLPGRRREPWPLSVKFYLAPGFVPAIRQLPRGFPAAVGVCALKARNPLPLHERQDGPARV